MDLVFLEVVYETGRMSVMEVDSEEEGKEGILAHHMKAIKGEPGGPLGQPAERIAAVYVYDEHPASLGEDQTMSAEVAEKELSDILKKTKDKDGVVSIDQVIVGLRRAVHPMVEQSDLDGFGSRFKMKENKKLDMSFLEGGAS
jgi:hypothetical protein